MKNNLIKINISNKKVLQPLVLYISDGCIGGYAFPTSGRMRKY